MIVFARFMSIAFIGLAVMLVICGILGMSHFAVYDGG